MGKYICLHQGIIEDREIYISRRRKREKAKNKESNTRHFIQRQNQGTDTETLGNKSAGKKTWTSERDASKCKSNRSGFRG